MSLLLLLAGGAAPSGPSLRSAAESAYPSKTISISVVAGDLIVIGFVCGNSWATASCADNASGGSNAYREHGTGLSGVGCEVHAWRAIAKATETLTVTISTVNGPSCYLVSAVYSGTAQDVDAVLDTYDTYVDPSAATSHPTATITTTNANDLLVSIFFDWSGGENFAGGAGGWTSRIDAAGDILEDRIVTSTGNYSGTVTSASTRANSFIMAFKAASSGSGLTLNATEGADSASGTMALQMALSLAASEGADLVAAAMLATIQAALNATEGADACASAVGLAVGLSLAATEGADILASSMEAVSSSSSMALNATEGADTAAATMALRVSMGLSATEGADAFASNVSLLITAAMAVTDGADRMAASVDVVGTSSLALSVVEGADAGNASADVVSKGDTGGAGYLQSPTTAADLRHLRREVGKEEAPEPAIVPAPAPAVVSTVHRPISNYYPLGLPLSMLDAPVEAPPLTPDVTDEEQAVIALLMSARAQRYRWRFIGSGGRLAA